jgi:DNA-binding response OmpR family regulator
MIAKDTSLPRTVLIVDDDELMLEALCGSLRAAELEVRGVNNAMEAITLLGRQWFPVVVTDREMPGMDGIELVHRLRALALSPTYVIMLTGSSDAEDYERGYCAGVDHYLVKKPDHRELVTRVLAGFSAVRRRQQAPSTPGGPVIIDLESGAHTARHLIGRLNAEIAHAMDAQVSLSIVSVCIETKPTPTGPRQIGIEASEALLEAVRSTLRPHCDWAARLPAGRSAFRLSIVMPKGSATEIAAFTQGLHNALVHAYDGPALRGTHLSLGSVLLGTRARRPTALELLGEAEQERRGAQKVASGTLRAVQGESPPDTAA